MLYSIAQYLEKNMREPRVLLIYPPNQLMDIETPRPDWSLSLLYPAGALRQIGIEPDIVDASIGADDDRLEDTFYRRELQPNGLTKIGMSWERIREFVAKGNYDIVGLDGKFTPQTNMALRVAQICKEVNPNTLVITGGVSARNMVNRLFKNGWIDIICTTEGENVIQEIALRFAHSQGFDGIPGTAFRTRDGEIREYPYPKDMVVQNLDKLPLPAWDKMPFEKLVRIASPHGVPLTNKNLVYAPLMTSRGCPFQCEYCHISMEREVRGRLGEAIEQARLESVARSGEIGKFRIKSDERVMQEIEILVGLFVVKIFLEDDSMFAFKPRIARLAKRMIGKGLRFADANGVNIVHLFTKVGGKLVPDKEILELVKEAGLHELLLPIESGSQRILNEYATAKVNLAIHDVEALFRVATREIGIVCPTNIMIGFPNETEEEMWQSVDMAKRLLDAGAAFVTPFIPTPYPGSGLFKRAVADNHLDFDFDPDQMNWKNGIMKNTTVPLWRIREIIQHINDEVNTPEHRARRIRESIGAQRLAGTNPTN